jgi:hypothetical protein
MDFGISDVFVVHRSFIFGGALIIEHRQQPIQPPDDVAEAAERGLEA